MKNFILEDLLRLGKEAGLKSFEQVIGSILQVLHVVLCILYLIGNLLTHSCCISGRKSFDYNLYNSLRDKICHINKYKSFGSFQQVASNLD